MFDRPALILARLKAPALLAAGMLGLWALLDLTVYRSGAYFLLAEPDSNTGAVVNALMLLDRQYRPGTRNVLVLGDSRVGEGFSASLATADADALNFINLSVPGSTPRTWSLMVREALRRGYRFEAAVIGTLYQPRHEERTADWPLDPAHHAALLGLGDAFHYPAGFESAAMRDRARQAVLLPALAMRQDTLAALGAPLHRARKLVRYRPGLLRAIPDYPGRQETMPELQFATRTEVADWGSADAAQRALVEAHLASLSLPEEAAIVASNRAYLGFWFGTIAAQLEIHEAQLLVFPLPRGPYREALPALTSDADVPNLLARLQHVTVLPADLLIDLEQPQYFFDVLHLNRAGRERLSTRLGQLVRTQLDAEAR